MVRLLSIAEETLAEFLSKATGTAVDWVQMLGMKVKFETALALFAHTIDSSHFTLNQSCTWNFLQPGPDSIGIVAVSHNCSGVAARACGLVSLEPTKVS